MKTVLVVLLLATVAMASGSESEVASLKGLRTFVVHVAYDKAVPTSHPSEESLQVKTELALRKTGIQVKGKGELNTTTAVFYIAIGTMPRPDGSYVFNISGRVGQMATLHSNGTQMFVVTWNTSTYGQIGSERLNDGLETTLSSVVDEFLNDYLKANPR